MLEVFVGILIGLGILCLILAEVLPSSFKLRSTHLQLNLEPRRLSFGACCLDVRTLAFCQLVGFPIEPLKGNFVAGKQKASEFRRRISGSHLELLSLGALLTGVREQSCARGGHASMAAP